LLGICSNIDPGNPMTQAIYNVIANRGGVFFSKHSIPINGHSRYGEKKDSYKLEFYCYWHFGLSLFAYFSFLFELRKRRISFVEKST
jgi:hypothetical protein